MPLSPAPIISQMGSSDASGLKGSSFLNRISSSSYPKGRSRPPRKSSGSPPSRKGITFFLPSVVSLLPYHENIGNIGGSPLSSLPQKLAGGTRKRGI